MIINENESSMIIVDTVKEKPSSFLNKYVAGLKQSENQIDHQREQLKKKIVEYDEACFNEVEVAFKKYKETINAILVEGLTDQFFGMDMGFINVE